MSFADARALCPDVRTEPADPVRADLLLQAIARWADRWSPWIARDGQDGLMLDITGCAHLYGGEAPMREEVVAQLSDMHIRAQAAIAGTKGAAWALSHYGEAHLG